MKKKNNRGKIVTRTPLCCLMAMLTVLFLLSGTIPVYAVSGPYNIGTVVDQSGNLTLTSGSGYSFYSDSTYTTSISGAQNITSQTTVYIGANTNYSIWSVTVRGADGSEGVCEASVDNGNYSIQFPASADSNQIIDVTTAVSAPGGTVETSSSVSDVAAMFNTGATGNTDNVTVEKSNNTFTVILKNNIILNGTVILGSNVTLNVLSTGDYMIKRGTLEGNIFSVPNTDSVLSLGSGTVTNDTITYYFNNGTNTTQAVNAELPAPPTDCHITHTSINSVITSTMTGTLTIDGGADLSDYTGTVYSFTAKTAQTNNNLIKVSNGSRVNIWNGVILQNNLSRGNDTEGGIAINVSNARLYMYGGIIRRCVNCMTNYDPNSTEGSSGGSSLGDGGALILNGANTEAFIYNAEISQCESDNSSAISLWSGSKLYFMNGTIHNNFAIGDTYYPAQALSVYGSSQLFMYGGNISDNNGINSSADLRISSGANILHLFGGTIDSLGSNTNDNKIFIYSGRVGSTCGLTNGSPMLGEVTYAGGKIQYQVTLPNAVNADRSQAVHTVVEMVIHTNENGDIIETERTVVDVFDSNGTGTANLVTYLPNGYYEIIVMSNSMKKYYDVTVSGADTSAAVTGRVMTVPIMESCTTDTVTLIPAGTGNTSSDGNIYYGYTTFGGTGTPGNWQASNVFSGLTAGTYYFYVKASNVGGVVVESISEESLEITLGGTPTVSLGNDITLICGGTATVTPSITPIGYSVNMIRWSLANEKSPDTRFSVNSDGSCSVTVAVGETAQTLQLTVTLSDEVADSLSIILISSNPVVRPVAGKTLNLITGNSSTALTSGNIFSFNIGFNYESDNSVSIASTVSLPVGTQIIMTDWANASSPIYYYCNISSAQMGTELTGESFTKMGGTQHSVDVGQTTYMKQFCFSMPDGNVPGSMTLSFSSVQPGGNANTINNAELTVTFSSALNPSGTVTLGVPESNIPRTLTASFTASASNIPTGYKAVCAIQLENNSGTPTNYPNGSTVMFGAVKATVRGYLAGINLTDINAVNNVTISGLGEGTPYKLTAYIYVIPNEVDKPINDALNVSKVSSTSTVVKSTPVYSLKAVLTAGSRIINRADIVNNGTTLTFSLNYSMLYGESNIINVSFYKKQESEYNLQNDWSVGGTSLSGIANGQSSINGVTVTIPTGSTEGTYRIAFELGGEMFAYNVIIK